MYVLVKSKISNYYYKYYAQLIPSHIKYIKIIDTNMNVTYPFNKNMLRPNSNRPHIFYKIKIWNQKETKYYYYIINDKIFNNLFQTEINKFIYEIDIYHKKYINSKIFTILINNNDVTDILYKYKMSISIPDNITTNVLYMEYCESKNILDVALNFRVIVIDYELNEKEYYIDEYIK